MDAMIAWGYELIRAVQTLRNPLLDALFLLLTFLGEEEFYLLLIPIFYWMVDKRLAARFALLFLLSVYVNALAKAAVAQPRPDPARVAVLAEADGGGLPSGHAQNALVSWGFLASVRREGWFPWAMGALIVAIGLSRIYLGAHFPHDVVGGWLLGALLLALFLALAPRAEAWLVAQPLAVQVALPALLALGLAVLAGEAALSAAATFFGLGVGLPLERHFVRFQERGLPAARLALRLVVGLAVALLIWRGLKPLLLPLDTLGDWLRYALLGLWVSVGGPWLFVRMGMALREGAPSAPPAQAQPA